ncbi:MAG: hypothetical protein E7099_08055 [Mediterranea massiliensis]|nr:hypothetical protein [Mediterranea massiliensis]
MIMKLFILSILTTLCFSCQQKQKMSRVENLVQQYFLGPMDSIIPLANGINPYSLIVDYCSLHPIDSTKSYREDEPYAPYEYYGLNGKTLEEIIEMYGEPSIDMLNWVYTRNVFWSDGREKPLHSILQNIKFPVPIYENSWFPYKNSDIMLTLYFIQDEENFRVIYGNKIEYSKMME